MMPDDAERYWEKSFRREMRANMPIARSDRPAELEALEGRRSTGVAIEATKMGGSGGSKIYF